VKRSPAATARETLIAGDPAWGEPATWRAIRTAGERFTLRHYLRALDLDRDAGGSIVRQPEELRIYVPLLLRTLMVSGAVTLLCLLLGYPIAHLIANSPPRRARWLILLVLVPFWTSLLVRTTAWIVLLQTHGVLNSLLVALGIVAVDRADTSPPLTDVLRRRGHPRHHRGVVDGPLEAAGQDALDPVITRARVHLGGYVAPADDDEVPTAVPPPPAAAGGGLGLRHHDQAARTARRRPDRSGAASPSQPTTIRS